MDAKKCIIYTRFSPRPNAAESVSCETQRDLCREYAERHGLQVVGEFDDPDRSGADEFRPQLWAALEALEKGAVLLVYKRDRLARNVYLSEQINRAAAKKGATIRAVTGDVEGDTPESLLIRQVLAAIAEYERKMIAARTSHAMRHHLKAGRVMGSQPPYGYRRDPDRAGQMIPDPAEAAVVAEVKARHECGTSYAALVRWLDENHPGEARGGRGKWNIKTVRKICVRSWLD